MEKLEWLPLYIDKLLSSPAWQDMTDFQRGWYIQLLLRCTRSERLGYLKMDSNLWTIAGAKRRDFFESHKSAVLACFKVREMEGHQWLYNDRLLSVMEDQSKKYYRRAGAKTSPSPSVFQEDITKTGEEVSLDDQRDEQAAPDLPSINLAIGLCEKLSMVAPPSTLRVVSEAIRMRAKLEGLSPPRACEKFLAVFAGRPVTRFDFEDRGKWDGARNGVSKGQQREDDSNAAIAGAMRAIAAESQG